MQRILHHLRRCECHPLPQTHIFKLRRLQHLEQYHILIPDILNVMPLVYKDIAHVPRRIIKCSCRLWGIKYRDSCPARDEEIPFIRIGMLVQSEST